MQEFFSSLPIAKELIAFIVSMIPLIELRGGIVFAAVSGIPFIEAFIICYLGNILPIPFILLFLKKIFEVMERNKHTAKIVEKLVSKVRKNQEKIEKYEILGLFIFVAIPLPGTGGWTGALIASVLGLPLKKSMPSILLGVLCAGIIMSVLSFAIPGLFFNIKA